MLGGQMGQNGLVLAFSPHPNQKFYQVPFYCTVRAPGQRRLWSTLTPQLTTSLSLNLCRSERPCSWIFQLSLSVSNFSRRSMVVSLFSSFFCSSSSPSSTTALSRPEGRMPGRRKTQLAPETRSSVDLVSLVSSSLRPIAVGSPSRSGISQMPSGMIVVECVILATWARSQSSSRPSNTGLVTMRESRLPESRRLMRWAWSKIGMVSWGSSVQPSAPSAGFSLTKQVNLLRSKSSASLPSSSISATHRSLRRPQTLPRRRTYLALMSRRCSASLPPLGLGALEAFGRWASSLRLFWRRWARSAPKPMPAWLSIMNSSWIFCTLDSFFSTSAGSPSASSAFCMNSSSFATFSRFSSQSVFVFSNACRLDQLGSQVVPFTDLEYSSKTALGSAGRSIMSFANTFFRCSVMFSSLNYFLISSKLALFCFGINIQTNLFIFYIMINKVSIILYYHIFSVQPSLDGKTFSGLEIISEFNYISDIMDAIASEGNFQINKVQNDNPNIPSPESIALFPNSSYSACINDVKLGHQDFCIGDLWVTSERNDLTPLVFPVQSEEVVFITRSEQTFNEFLLKLVTVFNWTTWLIFGSMQLVLMLVQLFQESDNNPAFKKSQGIMFNFSHLVSLGIPQQFGSIVRFKPRTIPGIIVNLAMVILSFIFITLYISNMTSQIIVNQFYTKCDNQDCVIKNQKKVQITEVLKPMIEKAYPAFVDRETFLTITDFNDFDKSIKPENKPKDVQFKELFIGLVALSDGKVDAMALTQHSIRDAELILSDLNDQYLKQYEIGQYEKQFSENVLNISPSLCTQIEFNLDKSIFTVYIGLAVSEELQSDIIKIIYQLNLEGKVDNIMEAFRSKLVAELPSEDSICYRKFNEGDQQLSITSFLGIYLVIFIFLLLSIMANFFREIYICIFGEENEEGSDKDNSSVDEKSKDGQVEEANDSYQNLVHEDPNDDYNYLPEPPYNLDVRRRILDHMKRHADNYFILQKEQQGQFEAKKQQHNRLQMFDQWNLSRMRGLEVQIELDGNDLDIPTDSFRNLHLMSQNAFDQFNSLMDERDEAIKKYLNMDWVSDSKELQ